jgi:hypothetical protein
LDYLACLARTLPSGSCRCEPRVSWDFPCGSRDSIHPYEEPERTARRLSPSAVES